MQVRSFARYSGRVTQALLHLKYHPDLQLAAVMGVWLEELYEREGWRAEVIVPVPLSKQRAQKRGFNQAALLADALSSRIDLPVDSSSLRRVEDTRSQVGLDPHERWKNVEHVFGARSQSLKGYGCATRRTTCSRPALPCRRAPKQFGPQAPDPSLG